MVVKVKVLSSRLQKSADESQILFVSKHWFCCVWHSEHFFNWKIRFKIQYMCTERSMLQKTGSGCKRQSYKWKVNASVLYDTHCPFWLREALKSHCRSTITFLTCCSIFTVINTHVGLPLLHAEGNITLLTQWLMILWVIWDNVFKPYTQKSFFSVVESN